MGQAQKLHKATAELVAKRQKLIEDIDGFTGRVLSANGETITLVVHSHRTHVVVEIKDWNEFSFWSESGKSQFGGEHLKVWYRTRLVLDVHWSQIKSCTVTTFDLSSNWQKAIALLMEDEAAALAKANAEKEAKRAAEKRAREERDRLAEAARNLERDAKRLGF